MASRSGLPPAQLVRSAAPDGDAQGEGIAADQEQAASVPPGDEERAVAAGRAPETPFVMLVAVAVGIAALVTLALVAVIVALWVI